MYRPRDLLHTVLYMYEFDQDKNQDKNNFIQILKVI